MKGKRIWILIVITLISVGSVGAALAMADIAGRTGDLSDHNGPNTSLNQPPRLHVSPTTLQNGTSSPIVVCNSPSVSIPDDDPTGVIDVISVGSGQIDDLNVHINTTHSFVGDLVYHLVHDDTGTGATLVDRPGLPPSPCPGDDINVILNDEAGFPVEDQCEPVPPAIIGERTPNQPLNSFDGEDMAGLWGLTVSDHDIGDVGVLNEWCLLFNTEIGPALNLTKTVALDPNICGLTNTIVVPGNVAVTYCYLMENTGSVTLTYHTVSDDQLGMLLGPDFVLDVGPGQSVWFTVTAQIVQPTVNIATWTVTDGGGGFLAEDSDMAMVQFSALQIYLPILIR